MGSRAAKRQTSTGVSIYLTWSYKVLVQKCTDLGCKKISNAGRSLALARALAASFAPAFATSPGCLVSSTLCRYRTRAYFYARIYSKKAGDQIRWSTLIEHRPLTLTVRTPQCGHTLWGTIFVLQILHQTLHARRPFLQVNPNLFG